MIWYEPVHRNESKSLWISVLLTWEMEKKHSTNRKKLHQLMVSVSRPPPSFLFIDKPVETPFFRFSKYSEPIGTTSKKRCKALRCGNPVSNAARKSKLTFFSMRSWK